MKADTGKYSQNKHWTALKYFPWLDSVCILLIKCLTSKSSKFLCWKAAHFCCGQCKAIAQMFAGAASLLLHLSSWNGINVSLIVAYKAHALLQSSGALQLERLGNIREKSFRCTNVSLNECRMTGCIFCL